MRIQGMQRTSKAYPMVCAICGKEYIAHNRSSMYCSDECRAEGQRKKNEYYRLNPDARPVRGPRPRKKRENPFTEILEAARAAGMSYGQYVASLKQQA